MGNPQKKSAVLHGKRPWGTSGQNTGNDFLALGLGVVLHHTYPNPYPPVHGTPLMVVFQTRGSLSVLPDSLEPRWEPLRVSIRGPDIPLEPLDSEASYLFLAPLPSSIRDAETKILIKFALWRGLGKGENLRKIVLKRCFSWEIP